MNEGVGFAGSEPVPLKLSVVKYQFVLTSKRHGLILL